MSDLRVGIVGLGWVAGAHIEAFNEVNGAQVTAICSRREHDPKALKQKFGIPLKPYTDYQKMLADPEIDLIDICTPHPFHADQTIAAAEAGKHLLIEKPICLTYEQAKAMGSAIKKAGVKSDRPRQVDLQDDPIGQPHLRRRVGFPQPVTVIGK